MAGEQEGHIPDTKNAASRSKQRREPAELPEIRREIIVDSGASQHMIGEKELHDSERATIRSVKDPFLIQTAHGIVPCDKEARIYVHDLNVWVWAGLLEDSPAVLSMGLLCKSMGFAFTWEEGAEYGYLPNATRPSGARPLATFPLYPLPLSLNLRRQRTVRKMKTSPQMRVVQ